MVGRFGCAAAHPASAEKASAVATTMRTPVACGVDVGSTNVKIVLLTRDGDVVARAGLGTPRNPQTHCIDGTALLATVEGMVMDACADRFEIHAISVAGVGEDGVLLDQQLLPLTPALAWFDPRRQNVLSDLRDILVADDTFDAVDDAGRTLVGWAWARQQPGAEAARTWVAIADLPSVAWTGRTFLSDTLASRTGAWRARDRSWDEDRVAVTLGAPDLLPQVCPTGDIVGGMDAPTLASAGVLAGDAIVVAGGHDHPIGGWGVNQMAPGAVLDSMGTAEVVVAQRPRPPGVRQPDIDLAPGIRSAGTTLLRVEELSRNVAWASQDADVAAAIHSIMEGRTQPAISLIAGGYFHPGPRGGGIPSYASDAPGDPHERATAVLGALAQVGRDAVDTVHGGAADRSGVRLAGGWARSRGWVAIKEMVNGYRTEVVAEPEVTALGAALLAAAARGWTPDPTLALSGGNTPVTPQ